MSKQKTPQRAAAKTAPAITPITILGRLLSQDEGGISATTLRLADDELAAVLAYEGPDGIEAAVLAAAQRICFEVYGDRYYQSSTFMKSLDGPNTSDMTPEVVRGFDTWSGFALGMAFALRLGGAR